MVTHGMGLLATDGGSGEQPCKEGEGGQVQEHLVMWRSKLNEVGWAQVRPNRS